MGVQQRLRGVLAGAVTGVDDRLDSGGSSPGARAFYNRRRAAGDSHHKALRALANRWVGILHGCLDHRTYYDENTAWAHRIDIDLKKIAQAA